MSDNAHAKFIRLKTGDDLVAECYEYDDGTNVYYTVINPLKVMYVSTGTGYLQVAFAPWIYPRICDLQEFNIPKSEVLLIQDVSASMDEYYWNNLEIYLNDKREEPEPDYDPETGRNKDTDMTEEEELDLYKKIMEHLGKGTLH